MSARVRQVAWVADVLVAVVLLAVSAGALARAEWAPRIVAGVSAALSFNFFYAQRSALPVRLHVQVEGRLPAECEATAYYVISEAFANAVKHASASARLRHGPHRSPAPGRSIRLTSAFQLAGR
jgi:hypothetical protein